LVADGPNGVLDGHAIVRSVQVECGM
jgi:hypothetical protein